MRRFRVSAFRLITTGMLVLLAGAIVALIVGDIAYVNNASIRETVGSPDIRAALYLTLVTSVISTLLALIFAVPAAYALSRYPFPGSGILDIVIDLLIVLPVLVVGVSILVFFRMGTLMSASPLLIVRMAGATISACGDFFIYQRPGIVLTQFFCSVSFALRVIKSTFDAIDPRTERVAMTLGSTRIGAFWRVTMPLARGGIVAGAVLAWVRAFGLFGPVSIVAGAVRQKTEVLATSIFLEVSIGRLEVALAISLLMIVIAFAVLLSLRLMDGRALFTMGERQ
jgi:molybdate transport system permease protein